MNPADKLRIGIETLGLDIQQEEQAKLLRYLDLLQKWNKVYNLTAIRDADRMVSNHLLDSLAVLPYLWPGKWLDVGAGAGLPGLVLAMTRPEWHFTLLDSNSKKTGFMQQAAIELGMQNVEISCERVEVWQPANPFDGIISRAFASAADFTELTRHLLANGGRWVAMKGEPEGELVQLSADIEVEQNIRLQIPGLDAARSVVIMKAI